MMYSNMSIPSGGTSSRACDFSIWFFGALWNSAIIVFFISTVTNFITWFNAKEGSEANHVLTLGECNPSVPIAHLY